MQKEAALSKPVLNPFPRAKETMTCMYGLLDQAPHAAINGSHSSRYPVVRVGSAWVAPTNVLLI